MGDQPSAKGTGGVADLLTGIRVIDFTQALSGPYGTLMLADLGADVVKVEPPRGDDSRRWGPPFLGADSTYFLSVNRNKRSIVLDLKTPDGLAAARSLITTADVLVENWRGGTADRLGIGYESFATNPGLVYCSITGFGPDGGDRAGYDQIVQGTAGTMTLTGPPGEPTKWGLPMGDIAAGMFAATAVIAAINARHRDGRGRRIDIAMEDTLIAMLTHHAARQLATGLRPVSDHNGHSSIAPYGMFATADGNVNICAGNDSHFQRMCLALSLPELAADPRFESNADRLRHRAQLLAPLQARLATMSADEVVAALAKVGVPAGHVRYLDEVLADPKVRARGMISTVQREDFGTAEVANAPWRIDGQVAVTRRPPPRLGEHTEEVMAELPPTC